MRIDECMFLQCNTLVGGNFIETDVDFHRQMMWAFSKHISMPPTAIRLHIKTMWMIEYFFFHEIQHFHTKSNSMQFDAIRWTIVNFHAIYIWQ